MERAKATVVALGALAIVGLLSLIVGIAARVTREEPAPPALIAGPTVPPPPDAAVEISEVRVDAGPYELDSFDRTPDLVAAGCPDVPLVDHPGSPVPWRPALRVHAAFVPTVEDVERAFVEAAVRRYGRAPEALLSASSYRCRAIRDRPERPSEHALGNALDVRGIVMRGEDGEAREITVRDHWGDGTIDDRFLHDAVRAVIERGRVRGVIGPPDADHLDHFHFDHGPSRFVSIEME